MVAAAIKITEKPILFSGPMVKAILEARKTRTRRVINPQPEVVKDAHWAGGGYLKFKGGSLALKALAATGEEFCPYGEVGDRLWVRETFAPCIGGAEGPLNPTLYRADEFEGYDKLTWKPSIFMPRWASRITLEITNIRVERLQAISESDIHAEGIDEAFCSALGETAHRDPDLVEAWCHGWDALNAKRGYSWESNPWVWVIEFKKIDERAAV